MTKKTLIEIYRDDDNRLITLVKTELEKKHPELRRIRLSRAYLINKIIDYALGVA